MSFIQVFGHVKFSGFLIKIGPLYYIGVHSSIHKSKSSQLFPGAKLYPFYSQSFTGLVLVSVNKKVVVIGLSAYRVGNFDE